MQISPLKLIEKFVEQLRKNAIGGTELSEQLEQLIESLDHRFASPETRIVIDDAVQRSPWLTSDAERLKQLQSDLIQSLNSCCIKAQSIEDSPDSHRALIEQLSDFAERFVEWESAHAELLLTAFPGPEWTK